jgi:hypothetical protein
MNALQKDASVVPDDSVDHVANALFIMQVTAPAAATVPASNPFDPAHGSVAAIRALDSTTLPTNIVVTASTLVDTKDSKVLNALEWIHHRLEVLDSPSRSPPSPPSPPPGPSSCSSPSIAVEAPVVSSSVSPRQYKI